jgi:hypothetical protein
MAGLTVVYQLPLPTGGRVNRCIYLSLALADASIVGAATSIESGHLARIALLLLYILLSPRSTGHPCQTIPAGK